MAKDYAELGTVKIIKIKHYWNKQHKKDDDKNLDFIWGEIEIILKNHASI